MQRAESANRWLGALGAALLHLAAGGWLWHTLAGTPRPSAAPTGHWLRLTLLDPAPARVNAPTPEAAPATPGAAHAQATPQAHFARPEAAQTPASLTPQTDTVRPSARPDAAGAPPNPTPAAAPSPETVRTPPRWDAAYLDNPPPRYPVVARQLGWEGTVILRVEVLDSGRAGHIQLAHSSGYDSLDQAAVNAVRQWRFVPARVGGQAVNEWVEVPVAYRLG